MKPILILGSAALAGLVWLLRKEKPKAVTPPPPPTPTPPTEKPVSRAELKRVMSMLGKRSGAARGGKL